MKTKISTIGISFLFALLAMQNISFAQSVWATQHINTISGNYLRRVQFVNSQTGFSCGGNGTFIKTIDGGDNWVTINTGSTGFLTSVLFLDENTGWVAGELGFLRKTIDGGLTWTTQTVPNATTFASMFFFDDQNGYITSANTGGQSQFAKTIDGGTTWNVLSTSSFVWGEIKFLNQQVGYVEAPNYFAKTIDGGVTWTRLLFEGSNQDFHFLNEQTGWVASENVMKKTINGGGSWSFSALPIDFPYSVKFINGNTGWCVGTSGNSGVICRTINAGVDWIVQKTESNNAYYDISFANSTEGWASGNSIISSTDNATFVSQLSSVVPDKFSLKQNYPNPFNPATTINFDVKNSSFVSLRVFDMTGREVKSLVNENLSAGSYEINFNASERNSGVYFYTLKTNEFTETKKMMLVK